jgi:hypothetical protein
LRQFYTGLLEDIRALLAERGVDARGALRLVKVTSAELASLGEPTADGEPTAEAERGELQHGGAGLCHDTEDT